MPSHWTYEKDEPKGDLYQGDIIERTGPLLKILGSVHKYFCDEKYLAFVVVSQTCDLVIRRGECKTRYINLAVVRSLESLMPDILKELCGTPVPGAYVEDGKATLKQLVERIINQNEQAQGVFYLHPDADVKIAVPAVALLRVSIALHSLEHYEDIKASRIGRLTSPFRNKMGWLTGNLYSRVDTPDWPETVGKSQADRKVDEVLSQVVPEGVVWVPGHLLKVAQAKKADFSGLTKDHILPALQVYAPEPQQEIALGRMAYHAKSLPGQIAPDHLKILEERLREDRSYPVLVAAAVTAAARVRLGDDPRFLEASSRVAAEDGLRMGFSAWMNRFSGDFMAARGRKNVPDLLSMLAERPLLEGELAERVRSVLAECLPGTVDLSDTLNSLRPTPAILDWVKSHAEMAVGVLLFDRLASRLRNDSLFRGAFQMQD